MNKNKLLIILPIVLGVIIIGMLIGLYFQNKAIKNTQKPAPSVTATATASVSPIISKTPIKSQVVQAASPTVAPTKTDEQLITEALASKLSENSSNLTITISKKSESAAYGMVTVTSEQSGGWFVAVEEGDHWKVIADGNGTIDCALMDQYNVPNTVVSECYDAVTESTKTR